jgi:dipeptidyl aminopeptidase/acylaminoacyl peptidase
MVRRSTGRRRLASGLGSLVLLASTVAVATNVGPSGAAFPGRNGRLFCSTSLPLPNPPPPPAAQTQSEIFAYNPDGSDPRRLTNNLITDLEPTPSPDGTRIAFTSTRSADQEIWVMYQDGSGLRQLTAAPGEDRPGTFSPDGTQIAFHSGRFPISGPGAGHSTFEIMIMNADGTNQRRMTNNNFQDSFAHWSPDGNRIAFTSNRTTPPGTPQAELSLFFDIWALVPVDANNDGNADVQTQLTTERGEDSHAHWSPDSSMLTFHSRRDHFPPIALGLEIYRMNANGTNPVRLTGPDLIFDVFPVWSPDGQRIAWPSGFPGDIHIMNASNGGNRVNITNTPIDESRCDWGRLLPCTITGSGQITGTEGNDVICGSSGRDFIAALGGDDVIYPGGGDDDVAAGSGNDIVFGDHGNDRISGARGNDTLFGDQGSDQISAGAGNDIASGSEANDQVVGGDGADECYGEARELCETGGTGALQ